MFFENEFHLSANHTNVKDDNTENRSGFGICAYRSMRLEKPVNVLVGLEFNQTRQFKKYKYVGHFASATNLSYFINSVSFAILCRANMGRRIKKFLAAGLLLDINVDAKEKGTFHGYGPFSNSNYEFVNRAEVDPFNYGPVIGLGMRIPVLKYEAIIQGDYKVGFNNLDDYPGEIYNRYFRLSLGFKI